MCKGVGKIPQRGAETSGAREVCPTCNGVGDVPAGTEVTHVYSAPIVASADVQVDEQSIKEGEPCNGNDGCPLCTVTGPKGDGATTSDSSVEDNAPKQAE